MRGTIHKVISVVGVAMAASVFAGASCSQPAIQCVVGHGPYAAKYELVEGTGSCAGLIGEEIGLATYLQPTADRESADYDKRRISVQSATFGGLFQERDGLGAGEEDKPYALGDLTVDPNEKELCFAGGAAGTSALAPAEMDVPEAETTDDDGNPVTLPARHLRQTWEDLSIYVTAAVPGTQMTGTMTYEDLIEGCKATYRVVALFPAVPCANAMGQPDDATCDPTGSAEEGRTGSGINPDFKVKCDPQLLYCVLDETPLPSR
jgi:hypothetical protein